MAEPPTTTNSICLSRNSAEHSDASFAILRDGSLSAEISAKAALMVLRSISVESRRKWQIEQSCLICGASSPVILTE